MKSNDYFFGGWISKSGTSLKKYYQNKKRKSRKMKIEMFNFLKIYGKVIKSVQIIKN